LIRTGRNTASSPDGLKRSKRAPSIFPEAIAALTAMKSRSFSTEE
jgi:hypothetical protein